VSRRNLAFGLLILSLAGVFGFSQGLRVIDTVGMFVCGALAGCALAELAAARRGVGRKP
jgi:hypothetical protein